MTFINHHHHSWKAKFCIIKKETKSTFLRSFGTEKSNGLNVPMKNVDKSFSFVVSFLNLIQFVLMLLFIVPSRFVFQRNFDDLSNFPRTNRSENFNHIHWNVRISDKKILYYFFDKLMISANNRVVLIGMNFLKFYSDLLLFELDQIYTMSHRRHSLTNYEYWMGTTVILGLNRRRISP